MCRQADRFEAVHTELLQLRDHNLKDNVALIVALQARGGNPVGVPSDRSELSQKQVDALPSQPCAECVSGTSAAVHWDGAQACKSEGGTTSQSDPAHHDTGLPGLLVGNTHLLFNPKRGDIKVGLPGLQAI